MHVALVTINDVPVTVGVDGFSFPIENKQVVHNESSRTGNMAMGRGKQYNDSYELACFAWEAQEFDSVEKH